MPVLATDNIELATDTILVVKSAGLDMPSYHEIERRVRWLVRIIDRKVIAKELLLMYIGRGALYKQVGML